MENRVRFALVGAGGIAQSYAQAFETCDVAQLAAVADVRSDAAEALAARLKCQSFTSYETLANSGVRFDAVVICTPPCTHEAVSTYFLERGKHVLCEKPFTTTSQSARRMLAAARRAGVQFAMSSKFRYVDDVIRAKSIVASGVLGEIILFENVFTSRVDMTGRWYSDPRVSGGGVLIDNGAHSVDLMRYFLGPLSEVHVVEGKRVQELPVEETVRMFVRSDQGVMGSIDLSWSIHKEVDGYVNVYGSNGTITVGWRESCYRLACSPDWITFGNGYDKTQAFRSLLGNFASAVQGREPLLITAEDALASVEVIEAGYASLRESHWTAIGSRRREVSRGPGSVLLCN